MKDVNVVSVSGGSDSTALYLLAIEQFGNDFLPVFSDTGHEHPVTVNYVRNLHHFTGGPKVQVVESVLAAGGSAAFLELAKKKKRFPSARMQFCTEHLKLAPILAFMLTNYPKENFNWVMHTGIVATESKKRSTMQPFMWNSFFDCLAVLPMLYESKDNLRSYVLSKGVELNPLYTIGNSSRVGCYPCIYAKKAELASLEDWAWEKLIAWEREVGSTFFAPNIFAGTGPKTADQVRIWASTDFRSTQFGLFQKANEIQESTIPACMSFFMECGT